MTRWRRRFFNMGIMDKLSALENSAVGEVLKGGSSAESLASKGIKAEINISEIVRREPFVSAFELEGEEFLSIKDSMADSGFDESQPVFLWETEEILNDPETGEPLSEQPEKALVLFDGHRRVAAAESCGIESVPARIFKDFENDLEVMGYVRKLQYSRRNVSETQRFKDLYNLYLEDRSFKSLPSAEVNGKGRERERIGRAFGVSPATANRWLTVIKTSLSNQKKVENGDEDGDKTIADLLGKVLKGTMTANAAHKAIEEKKALKKRGEQKEAEKIQTAGPKLDSVPQKQLFEKDSDSTESETWEGDKTPNKKGFDSLVEEMAYDEKAPGAPGASSLTIKAFLGLLEQLRFLKDSDPKHTVKTHLAALVQAGVFSKEQSRAIGEAVESY